MKALSDERNYTKNKLYEIFLTRVLNLEEATKEICTPDD